MTEPVSDDVLFAFIEGGLSADARARIEALLGDDAALQARLAQVRRAHAALQAAYATPPGSPARFEQLVEDGFRERERQRFRQRPAFDWRQPMAAAFALAAVAGGSGYWLGQIGSHQAGMDLMRIAPGNPLFAALEQTPSGETMRVGADGAVKPILTFQSLEGDYCREVEFDSAAASSAGVACRDDGGWRMIVLAASETGPSASGYATVGEAASASIESAFQSLGGGDPLSPEAERALIRANWQAQ